MTSAEIGQAIRAFHSETCPACGVEKGSPEEPFCAGCMRELPDELACLLADRSTFIDAFGPAMRHLGKSRGDDLRE